ncbi:hypothetical protein TNCT_403041 [Trichonephila clavata]|uniref:Uncharacterized protein n=1 Tax=Trichonephila clavata TaxID=2740835 RepID=A0A8X6FCA9_TRICU|nr:hypothetical protein TNCT_403041 [Trichonephila clavata]
MENSKKLEVAAKIFATKLIHCVMSKDYPDWILEAAFEDYNCFPECMQKKMENICQLNSYPFWMEFCQSFAGKEKTKVTFEKFCFCMSSIIQQEEVNKERFLNYACKLAVFSSYMYRNCTEAPNIAISHITNVLFKRYPDLLQNKPIE